MLFANKNSWHLIKSQIKRKNSTGFQSKIFYNRILQCNEQTEILLISLTQIWRESVAFELNFQNWVFDKVAFLRSPESENQIFGSLYVRAYAISITQKQTGNLVFGILDLYYMEMLFEAFCEDWTNSLCTGTNERIPISYGQ